MRLRDLKAKAKSEQSVNSETSAMIEHKCRRGDRYWSDDEHERFLEAIRLHGKNWSEITRHIGSRPRQSVYSHAQKFRKRVLKEPTLHGAECAKILSQLDTQHYGQSSIMRSRLTTTIEDIRPSKKPE